ncbi:MAG TPA: alpha/beta fold hydrolase [Candidatus Dormibacteraeota bacterium]|nr:alpha/beta fold hydrolase [Candidatus Dormibacteraeota bacterium]
MTPDEHTNQEFFLDVGDGHRLYVQDWGLADAKMPIMVLHGGPGNGVDDRDKRKFDPTVQRVIFHDQRGAGQSLPTGSLTNNTTQDLVTDIEAIAQHLQLDKFVLVGGSWGSTLALAYGIAHPERVAAMVIDGVFTAAEAEIDWFDQGGWRQFFPDVWDQYLDSVPAKHRQNPTAYHLKTVLGDDPAAAKQSAYAYQTMELALLKLDDRYYPGNYSTYEPGAILIEMHYLANRFFMPADYILKHAGKLTMPIYMVAGRYDLVTPPVGVYELNKKLPDGHLTWTINGHLRQHEALNVHRLMVNRVTGVE